MSTSFLSKPYQARADFIQALEHGRQQTLKLVSGIQSEIFRTQSHPDFSPVGWHLGHIAYTEAMWMSEGPFEKRYEKLFSADGLPKSQRQNLPELEEILAYMDAVRACTLQHLQQCSEKDGSEEDARLWYWLIQHESQHLEIMTMVLAMHQQQGRITPLALPIVQQSAPIRSTPKGEGADMILIEAGEFSQGCDAPEAIDNERPVHSVSLDRYWIDRMPVTCKQFWQFIASGGYQTAKYWSEQGWQWQRKAQVKAPLYWEEGTAFDEYPVCGVSWYEADAYARFVGKRLPTESEWERAATAAGCEHMMGSVWEWTDSWFTGYAGFQSFPYEEYSQLYFDREHRVLRGGSWATSGCLLRRSFRNWYHPHRRELFAGFRCAA